MSTKNQEILDLYKSKVMPTYTPSVVIASGKGITVRDVDGHAYYDFTSGIGVQNVGYGNKKVVEAIQNQAAQLTHCSNLYVNVPMTQLAAKLVEISGLGGKAFFCNSGAEANECAIKVARKYSFDKYGEGRGTIITLKNSFHGRTITTLAATGQESFHTLYTPLTEGFVSTKANDLDAFIKLAKSTKCAGIMLETVQGEGGVNVLDFDFVKGVEKYAKENDISKK